MPSQISMHVPTLHGNALHCTPVCCHGQFLLFDIEQVHVIDSLSVDLFAPGSCLYMPVCPGQT